MSVLGLVVLAAAGVVSVAVSPVWRCGTGWSRLTAVASRMWRHPRAGRWGPVVAALLGAVMGLAAGPVASAVLGAYAATAFLVVRGLAVARSRQRAYRLAADAVIGLAADLRAGAAITVAWRAAREALDQARGVALPGWRPAPDGGSTDVALVERRVAAATALAEASGAPLADVLDRLDTHLRAVDRARSVASSQAAGARVSAGLLAAMPVAGVGLGVVVGVDAWRVLLHTPLGALAVGLGVMLQLAGLAWAARLAAPQVSP